MTSPANDNLEYCDDRNITDDDAKAIAIRIVEELGSTTKPAVWLPALSLPPIGACDKGGFVYFIQCRGGEGAIKIGWTKDIARRVHNLQMSCPIELALVAYHWANDAEGVEYDMHEDFAWCRIRGEWFRPVPELTDLIGRITQNEADRFSRLLGTA